MKKSYRLILSFLFFSSCFSVEITAQVSKKAIDDFLNDSAVKTGHAGISIYEPATGKYLYNYNAEKNFLPSSNTKLFTLYAGMKYLGDSLIGLKYMENDTAIQIFPTGDPSFLHPDMVSQPVFDFLKSSKKTIILGDDGRFMTNRYGMGWVWDDYSEDFMAERSSFPVYGNTISFTAEKGKISAVPFLNSIVISSKRAAQHFKLSDPIAIRDPYSNNFTATNGFPYDKKTKIPFTTSFELSRKFLSDTLHKSVIDDYVMIPNDDSITITYRIHSRPVDSLFRPMMFHSDNFFAEQTLLMVSNEKLGYMSDEDIIDTLLKNDFKDIPTKPRWVDGSGLSRYNLFSPKDLIYILVKLKNEFGWERIKNILPAGGEGTLAHYYEDIPEAIHAKTGSMSNNVSQSGYITTKKGKTLLFSVIINNFSGTGTSGRKAIERLIRSVIGSN